MRSSQLKEKTLYREIIRGAFEIAWHRRELWLLGLAASFLMMNGGAFEFIVRAVFKISSGVPYAGAIAYGRAALAILPDADMVTQMSLFMTTILFFAIFLLVAVLAVSASGGLLAAAARLAARRKTDLRAIFANGLEKTGPLLLTQAVGRTIIFVTFTLAALGVYVSGTTTGGLLASIALFVVFAVVAMIVSFLMMMTNAGIMIGGETWIRAAEDACRFFKKHWLISLEMIGLIFTIAFAVALAILVGMLIFIIPFTMVLLALSALHVPGAMTFMSYLLQFILFAAVITGGSMLAVFGHSAWALLYVRLSDQGAVAKLERLWQSLVKRDVRAGR